MDCRSTLEFHGDVDSKIVNKQIRSEVRPLLKEAGFTRFTARNSWRYTGPRIDIINFQSFNSYKASVMGCTTYSFTVNLGCYFTDIPDRFGETHLKKKDKDPRPLEYDCSFRGGLHRRFTQPEYEDRSIWYIDPRGRYLEKALHDVRKAIAQDGLPWFERLADPAHVLQILLEQEENMNELWGFGRNPSPIRHYLTGYFALNLGHNELARRHLNEALKSNCFDLVAERIERDLEGITRESPATD